MIMENSGIRNKWSLSGIPDNAEGEIGHIAQRQILKKVKCYTRHVKITSRQLFAFSVFWSDGVAGKRPDWDQYFQEIYGKEYWV